MHSFYCFIDLILVFCKNLAWVTVTSLRQMSQPKCPDVVTTKRARRRLLINSPRASQETGEVLTGGVPTREAPTGGTLTKAILVEVGKTVGPEDQ